MQLSAVTAAVAPLCGLTPDALRIRVQRLYVVPELAALGMGGRRAAHTDRGLAATNVTAGLLTLTAALSGNPATIGRRVLRSWRAPYAGAGNACPVTGAGSLGDAITLLLTSATLAARLDFLDLARETELIGLAWTDRPYQPSLFHPDGPRGYRRVALAHAETGRLDQIARVPGSAMRLVAALIADETLSPPAH